MQVYDTSHGYIKHLQHLMLGGKTQPPRTLVVATSVGCLDATSYVHGRNQRSLLA